MIDPDGLVHSQAAEAPDGRFRRTLNDAEPQRSLAGYFLATRFEIAPDLLVRMKELQVLYDEDENSAFFQYLSNPYGAGPFLETCRA